MLVGLVAGFSVWVYPGFILEEELLKVYLLIRFGLPSYVPALCVTSRNFARNFVRRL